MLTRLNLTLRFFLIVLMASMMPALVFAEDYLEPEKAFVFSAKMADAKTVLVTYTIADGYYMYRERFKFSSANGKLGTPKFPHGKIKFDETFNKEVETFRNKVTIEIPVEASGEFSLTSIGQGCADAGLCYPPLESEAKLVAKAAGKADEKATKSEAGQASVIQVAKEAAKADAKPAVGAASAASKGAQPLASASPTPASIPAASAVAVDSPPSSAASGATDADAAKKASASAASRVADLKASIMPSAASQAANPPAAASDKTAGAGDNELGTIQASLQRGKLIEILPWFFLLGLGLSFTPCVLPMVPILSFIIVGEGVAIRRSRSFMLSVTYVLGMALVYTALGVAAGLLGEGLAASLQNPVVLSVFGLLMVALALSMFGFYRVQVPSSIQAKLSQTSEHQARGKMAGVFVMGAISALIVGPCVAAPLAGTLVFISQTHDVVIGGAALFAMALGMGVPLLLVGASAGSLLPKAGHWMESVERFFGVLMLATALWMVSPVLPGAVQVAGWAMLGLGYGAYLIWARDGHWMAKAFGLAFAILGALELVGLVSGGRDPLAPLGKFRAEVAKAVPFQRVKSVAELDAILAQNRGRPVMLDFYADWCVSCKEMEKLTFSEPAVQAKLRNALLLQADVTINSAEDKALLKRFQLFGPPGIIFFDGQGQEVAGRRVVGYQNSDKFGASLAATGLF